VDFVFGITGQSWFQGCTLGIVRARYVLYLFPGFGLCEWRKGSMVQEIGRRRMADGNSATITAQGRTSSSTTGYFVFDKA
jgi:hypothetical protein